MGLGEQPGSMPSGKQEPLEGSRLPGATGVAGEVVHERGDPHRKGASRCMEDRIVGERPEERARSAPPCRRCAGADEPGLPKSPRPPARTYQQPWP
eukprot:154567-Alexandrium_andersonii.AAC.1